MMLLGELGLVGQAAASAAAHVTLSRLLCDTGTGYPRINQPRAQSRYLQNLPHLEVVTIRSFSNRNIVRVVSSPVLSGVHLNNMAIYHIGSSYVYNGPSVHATPLTLRVMYRSSFQVEARHPGRSHRPDARCGQRHGGRRPWLEVLPPWPSSSQHRPPRAGLRHGSCHGLRYRGAGVGLRNASSTSRVSASYPGENRRMSDARVSTVILQHANIQLKQPP